MRSMTGFSREDASAEWGRLELELRTVNQRHLDLNFQLATQLRSLEPNFREQLRGRIQRGKVDITLRYFSEQQEGTLRVDSERLNHLQRAMEEVEQRIVGIAQPTSLDVLQWPGVIASSTVQVQALREAAVTLFDQGLAALEEAREREGARLTTIIGERLDAIEQETAAIRELLPAIVERQRHLLLERASAASLELDDHRLGAELAMLVQRADVAEELDRLTSHVSEIRHQLGSQQPVGRRLDFLVQELNREANTLASKSVVKETTHRAVELKVLIEQIREQVQNVE
ncbi:YicC/YloC family endoribonuclease [Carnimonas nigrificans]|uniref:YicC/YloC family endoribonuclease n=1 Tax=Carnimonas nigrificans TaxID=64323 RepID=UPI000470CCD2|nr:YicC/YloC family endoribonuclease [Carnimonas nigrificans]